MADQPLPKKDNEIPVQPELEQSSIGIAASNDPIDWETNAQAARRSTKRTASKLDKLKNLGQAYWSHKRWTLPLTLLALIIVVMAVPVTRYQTLGLVIKHEAVINLIDDTTGRPVSSASINAGSKAIDTDANGRAKLRLGIGPHTLTVTKKYYTTTSSTVQVPLFTGQLSTVKIMATGRQVPIVVTNKITGHGLPGVTINVAGSKAKTDMHGKAVIVLPTKSSSQKATLQLAGYNQAPVVVQITDQVVAANSFNLTPVGKIYFLSNLSGKLDVVKTNLDGTSRQTVLAGTGSEDANNTSLLASRDWKYLALLSKRSGSPAVYLINTTTGQVTNIDSTSNATFQLVGWNGDYFVYQIYRTGVPSWQSQATSIKSYDAVGNKLIALDNSDATGSSDADAKYDTYGTGNVQLIGNLVVFARTWYVSPGYLTVPGQQNTLVTVRPDGTNKKTVATLDAGQSYFGSLIPYWPQKAIVQVAQASGSASPTYYTVDSNGAYAPDTDSDVEKDVASPYPTYLLSPSGKQTFWSEVRDNKNTLFIGDANAQGPTQIASLSEDTPYGWYTDNYLLVSSGGSQLYIIPASGSRYPLKVTDYFKPQLTYRGYGGGYGGL